jgi:predicted DNA-binding transcriptional regulator YafY
MAKKETLSAESAVPITPGRANRLFLLVTFLGQKKQTRDQLTKKLKVGVRDFYRDLETLRAFGIHISHAEGHYRLDVSVTQARAMLPFPDPVLTLGEAEVLAQGPTAAHKKLRKKVEAFQQTSGAKSGKSKKS